MMALTAFSTLLCLIGSDPMPAANADETVERYEYREDHDRDGIGKFYMGREIAQVMGHRGAAWLERSTRNREEKPDQLVETLRFEPGMNVADIGAGTGYFTFRIAPLVGPEGKVYAVDIQKEMLDLLSRTMREEGVENVVPVQGAVQQPNLPQGKIDLALMVDVYHEFSHPWEMTRAMVDSLAPGGQLVFVEYRKEDPWVPIKPLHKMTEKQVLKEMEPHSSMRWVGTVDVLPRQHIIIFEKRSETDSSAD